VQHCPAEQEEYQHSNPENPLILLSPSLHHPNRIPADPERVGNTIQSPLRTLEDFPLLSQIRKHRAPPVEKFIQLITGIAQE